MRSFCLTAVVLISACQTPRTNISTIEESSLKTTYYQKAEQFLPRNISQLTRNLTVRPNWIGDSGRFWFSEQNSENDSRFFLVTPQSEMVEPLFDHQKLADALSIKSKASPDIYLGLNKLSINDNLTQLTFSLNSHNYQCELPSYECIEEKPSNSDKTVTTDEQGELSPDKKWRAQVINWDLYLTNVNTQKKNRITFDGSEEQPYAVNNANPRYQVNQDPDTIKPELSLYWSPDGKSLITHKLDRKNVGKLHLIQSVTGNGLRPRLFSYYYPLAGDKNIPYGDIIEVKLDSLTYQVLDAPKSIQTYYGGPIWGW